MASLIVDLITGLIELAYWVIWEVLPLLCLFTAFAVVFVATFGKVSVEWPEKPGKIGWTGIPRVARSPQGRMILSPALGVIVGFMIWAVVVSAVVIFHAYWS
ncbi:MAG TPA: hypothetical protein VF583_23990 [Bradyrhizobium sp.]